jgi:hypothetical protein
MLNRRNVLLLTGAFPVGLATMGTFFQMGGTRAAEARLALKGHDPVAYFTEGRPLLGKEEFEYAWDEVRYRFASESHMSTFRGDPDRYAPQFAGSCAMGMSKGVKVEADPDNWLISDGRLFVFYSADARSRFQVNQKSLTVAADGNWQQLKEASFGTKLAQ